MALSAFMVQLLVRSLVGAAIAAVVAFVLLRQDRDRPAAGGTSTKLTVPLFKRMFRALYISRSLHTMGELLNAGVPMLDTLAITGDISGNLLYKKMWRNVYAAVKQGKKIQTPARPHRRCCRKSVVQMIAAGEESGKLGEVLDEISRLLLQGAARRDQGGHEHDRADHDRRDGSASSASSPWRSSCRSSR